MKKQDSQTPQPKLRRLKLTDEQLERVKAVRARHEGLEIDDGVTPEDYFLAEFGYFFGWDGIKAIHDNEISMPDAELLLKAEKKVWYSRLYDMAHVNLVAFNAAQAENPGEAFKKGMSNVTKLMKVKL